MLVTRSTIERGRGCNKFVPVLKGNGTKIAPTGDICVQPPGEMSWIRGKLADHVGDHAVLSRKRLFCDLLGDVIVAFPPFPIVEQLLYRGGISCMTARPLEPATRVVRRFSQEIA